MGREILTDNREQLIEVLMADTGETPDRGGGDRGRDRPDRRGAGGAGIGEGGGLDAARGVAGAGGGGAAAGNGPVPGRGLRRAG